MHRPSPLPVKLCLQLPTFCTPLQHLPARLKNPHAVCYLNASAQALYWLGALTASPRECYGAAQAALKPLMRSGRPFLPSCLPWGPLLRGWHHLSTQHDACEFMVHLLDKAAPAAFEGSWQSRLSDPFTITDEGPLRTPILLDLRGETLQGLVDSWSVQASIQALVECSGVIMLQIKRYGVQHGGALQRYHTCPHPAR